MNVFIIKPFDFVLPVKKGSTESFNVNFTKGSDYKKPDNTSCNLSMDMTFTCNRGSMWTAQGDKGQRQVPVDPKYLKTFKYDAELCKVKKDFFAYTVNLR